MGWERSDEDMFVRAFFLCLGHFWGKYSEISGIPVVEAGAKIKNWEMIILISCNFMVKVLYLL